MKTKPEDAGDLHFATFAKVLEETLARECPDGIKPKHRFDIQKKSVEALVAAEKHFRLHLIRHRYGDLVYRGFMSYIRDERANILAARPFFRERDEVFKRAISPVLARGADPDVKDGHRGLYTFTINGRFVQFVLRRYAYLFKGKSPVMRYALEAQALREALVKQNAPLAINRAKLFRSKTPSSPHMANMDAIQVSLEGLISAIDKYVLPFSASFRAVIIGRITGNLIATYSEPMLHFYPGDRRKIYRANKARRRTQEVDKIVESVNDGLPEAMKTNGDEIQQLLNASSHVSLDQPMSTEDGASSHVDYAVDDGQLPDEIAEKRETSSRLRSALLSLTLIERKALALKGMVSV